MSDNISPEREWKFYINDMIDFAEKVLAYTGGMNQDSFASSGISYDAVLRNLELIGEAATHIPESVRKNYSDISWRRVIATRNRLIHAYLGIDKGNQKARCSYRSLWKPGFSTASLGQK